jgi:hypothetical protein
MKLIFLSLIFILPLSANEVILSAIKGEFNLHVGERLKTDTPYKTDKNSKIQLLINKSASITLSKESKFELLYIDTLTCKIRLTQGVLKIFNLSDDKNSLDIIITTPYATITVKDSISLIKLTKKELKTASAKNTLQIKHQDREYTLSEKMMAVIDKKNFKKSKIFYDDFREVFIKSMVKKRLKTENQFEDPSDLEN